MIKKILIANRGEIALRIQRTARRLGLATVAVYAVEDGNAAFVKNAEEAVLLEGAQLSDTYLNIEKIINAALQSGADAIHPGYGFLSENTALAEACEKNGIRFIGPDAAAMRIMGNKISAREAAIKSGIPVTPGITGTVETLLQDYKKSGFPLLIKAAAGGGGKGMRVVRQEAELQQALEATTREAKNYFGDGTVYIEKYIEKPRHIEVQVLGDQYGNMVHLYERECSLQRRHQKIVEEAPSPALSKEVRKSICNAAVQLALSIGYYSAGTIEFLLDEAQQFYFLEMNARIQVEHPVTELITGVDIVEEQIKIANGEQLNLQQENIHPDGHAIECRIYAEDPQQNFLPAPGRIEYYEEPQEIHEKNSTIRLDGMQLQSGDVVSGDYDPMISKLTVWARTREEARLTMLDALQQYHIKGIRTNTAFLCGLLQHPDYINNHISTKYIDLNLDNILNFISLQKEKADILIPLSAGLIQSFYTPKSIEKNIWQTIGFWRQLPLIEIMIDGNKKQVLLQKNSYPEIVFTAGDTLITASLELTAGINGVLSIHDKSYSVSVYQSGPGSFEVTYSGCSYQVERTDITSVDGQLFTKASGMNTAAGNIVSPMPGKVIKVNVLPGDKVKKGDILLIVEAMKMENNIISPADAVVENISVREGDKVGASMKLVKLSET